MSRFGLCTLARLSAAALLAGAMAACGAHAKREPESPTPSGAAVTAPAGDQTAGPIALAYMHAIMRNDYDAALPLVVSDQREMLKALALGQGPGTLPTLSANLGVGQIVVSGNRATVTLVGRMCRTPARRHGSKPRTECIENEDPKSDSPTFRVHLVREVGWKVAYDVAAGDGG